MQILSAFLGLFWILKEAVSGHDLRNAYSFRQQ